MAFLDATAVVTALRTIQRQFNATSAETQWIMGAYLLALASLMAATGRLADLYGRRKLLVGGAALFGLGSIACAAAPNEELLIAAPRARHGRRAADAARDGKRHRGVARRAPWLGDRHRVHRRDSLLALGPLVGGGLTELAGWRWIFLINVPTIIAIIVIALRAFPKTRADRPEPLDLAGLGLLVGGLVSLVLALLNMQEWGPGAPVTVALLCVGVGLLVGFAIVERRTRYPLISLDLLRIPAVAGSLCALFAIQFAILGLTVHVTEASLLRAKRGGLSDGPAVTARRSSDMVASISLTEGHEDRRDTASAGHLGRALD